MQPLVRWWLAFLIVPEDRVALDAIEKKKRANDNTEARHASAFCDIHPGAEDFQRKRWLDFLNIAIARVSS